MPGLSLKGTDRIIDLEPIDTKTRPDTNHSASDPAAEVADEVPAETPTGNVGASLQKPNGAVADIAQPGGEASHVPAGASEQTSQNAVDPDDEIVMIVDGPVLETKSKKSKARGADKKDKKPKKEAKSKKDKPKSGISSENVEKIEIVDLAPTQHTASSSNAEPRAIAEEEVSVNATSSKGAASGALQVEKTANAITQANGHINGLDPAHKENDVEDGSKEPDGAVVGVDELKVDEGPSDETSLGAIAPKMDGSARSEKSGGIKMPHKIAIVAAESDGLSPQSATQSEIKKDRPAEMDSSTGHEEANIIIVESPFPPGTIPTADKTNSSEKKDGISKGFKKDSKKMQVKSDHPTKSNQKPKSNSKKIVDSTPLVSAGGKIPVLAPAIVESVPLKEEDGMDVIADVPAVESQEVKIEEIAMKETPSTSDVSNPGQHIAPAALAANEVQTETIQHEAAPIIDDEVIAKPSVAAMVPGKHEDEEMPRRGATTEIEAVQTADVSTPVDSGDQIEKGASSKEDAPKGKGAAADADLVASPHTDTNEHIDIPAADGLHSHQDQVEHAVVDITNQEERDFALGPVPQPIIGPAKEGEALIYENDKSHNAEVSKPMKDSERADPISVSQTINSIAAPDLTLHDDSVDGFILATEAESSVTLGQPTDDSIHVQDPVRIVDVEQDRADDPATLEGREEFTVQDVELTGQPAERSAEAIDATVAPVVDETFVDASEEFVGELDEHIEQPVDHVDTEDVLAHEPVTEDPIAEPDTAGATKEEAAEQHAAENAIKAEAAVAGAVHDKEKIDIVEGQADDILVDHIDRTADPVIPEKREEVKDELMVVDDVDKESLKGEHAAEIVEIKPGGTDEPILEEPGAADEQPPSPRHRKQRVLGLVREHKSSSRGSADGSRQPLRRRRESHGSGSSSRKSVEMDVLLQMAKERKISRRHTSHKDEGSRRSEDRPHLQPSKTFKEEPQTEQKERDRRRLRPRLLDMNNAESNYGLLFRVNKDKPYITRSKTTEKSEIERTSEPATAVVTTTISPSSSFHHHHQHHHHRRHHHSRPHDEPVDIDESRREHRRRRREADEAYARADEELRRKRKELEDAQRAAVRARDRKKERERVYRYEKDKESRGGGGVRSRVRMLFA